LVTAFNRALAEQLRRWRTSQPGARADDQRDLKALRAAARRSNAAFWVFGDCFRKRPVKDLRARLKIAEKALGEVRDWDLAIDEAEEAFEGQDNGLLADWRKQRKRAHKKAAAWFEAEAEALQHDLERVLVEAPLKKGSLLRLDSEAPTLLLRPLKGLREAFDQLDRDDELPALHEVRIALKRVRFTIEFLVPYFGDPAERLLPTFIRAQDRLGGINDLHVAHNRVLDFLSRNPGDADALDYARLLASQIKKQLSKAQADVQPLRPDVLAVEFSRWSTVPEPASLHVDLTLEPESELE
jgi:CHAD domain-containing protein